MHKPYMLSVFNYMVSECTSNIIFFYCCFITAESHRVQMKLVWKYLKNAVLQWPAGGNFYECKNGSYRKPYYSLHLQLQLAFS